MEYLLEYREYKKLKSNYWTKRISISKIQLEDICNKLNIPSSKIKFLSSGKYGNAYKVGNDKVLKITTDKTEANTISNIIYSNINNKSIVKYYSINQYKLNNQYVYIIVMDYLTPIMDYIKQKTDKDYYDFLNLLLDIIYEKWMNISKSDFIDSIEDYYSIDKLPKFSKELIDKIWKIYSDLKYLEKCPDLHIGNLGINKNNDILLFDFNDLKSIRKFNNLNII